MAILEKIYKLLDQLKISINISIVIDPKYYEKCSRERVREGTREVRNEGGE